MTVEEIAMRVWQQNGAALLIDYGEEGSSKHTFRVAKLISHTLLLYNIHYKAFRSHQVCDPLTDPGSCDLTADVDFATLKNIVDANGKLSVFIAITIVALSKFLSTAS